MQRQGLYPMPPTAPKILGLEFSGVIVAVGGGEAKTWDIGAEVFGLVYGGAYAEFVVVDERMLILKPAGLSWEMTGGLCEVSCLHFSSASTLKELTHMVNSHGSRLCKHSTSLAVMMLTRPARFSGMLAHLPSPSAESSFRLPWALQPPIPKFSQQRERSPRRTSALKS